MTFNQRDMERMGARLRAVAEAVMSCITTMPPEVQGKCVRQSAKLVDLMVKLDGIVGVTEGGDAKGK